MVLSWYGIVMVWYGQNVASITEKRIYVEVLTH